MDIKSKLVTAVASMASAFVAEKLVDLIWKFLFHRERPNAEDPTEPLRDVLVFAIVSASTAAVLNDLATRKTHAWIAKKTEAKNAEVAPASLSTEA